MITSTDGLMPSKAKIHKRWMILLLFIGALFIYAAFPEDILWGWLTADNSELVQSTLISFGVAVFSAGLLLIVEPKLRTVVRETTETAVQVANESLREEIFTDINTKFSSFEERMEKAVEDDIERENSRLQDLESEFSYDHVTQAMSIATDKNAIHSDTIFVNATNVPGELRIGFALSSSRQNNVFSGFGRINELKIYAVIGTGPLNTEVLWNPEDDATRPFTEIIKNLEASNGRQSVNSTDWNGIHRRLFIGLDAAIKSRRGDPHRALLMDTLIEVADFEQIWFLTDISVECPERDFVYQYRGAADPEFGIRLEKPINTPERPDWVDPKVWDYLAIRIKQQF